MPKFDKEQANKRLLALLAEAKSRGIPIPKRGKFEVKRLGDDWNRDKDGFFINVDGKRFNTRPELTEFIESTERFMLLRAGRGSGKSSTGIQKALRKVSEGKSGAVLAPTFEQFKDSTWQELRQWIPWNKVIPKHRYRQSPSFEPARPFSIVFKNGAKITCKGLKDPESARGANINWLMYDEGRIDVTGIGWKNAIAAVRVGENPQAWCTTTPANSQHWTSTFFSGEITDDISITLNSLGLKSGQSLFKIIETSIDRNKENIDPLFYASILATYPSGYLRAREVEGRVADETDALGTRNWFIGVVDGKPRDNGLEVCPDWVNTQVRFWDLAATEEKMMANGKKNDPDETVGSLVGANKDKNKFVLTDQVGGHWAWHTIKQMVLDTARKDGQEVKVCFEQEPASGGKNQIAELVSFLKDNLPGWDVSGLEARKLGDRVLAANVWFGEAAQGNWYYVKGLWNEPFFSQLDYFPNKAVHDDRITSVTGARHKIAPVNKWKKIPFLAIGQMDEPRVSADGIGFGAIDAPAEMPFVR